MFGSIEPAVGCGAKAVLTLVCVLCLELRPGRWGRGERRPRLQSPNPNTKPLGRIRGGANVRVRVRGADVCAARLFIQSLLAQPICRHNNLVVPLDRISVLSS